MTATITPASVVAQAKRVVASTGVRPVAAYSLKKGGTTATITVVQNAELAQSYMAQARSSPRDNPRRLSQVPFMRVSMSDYEHGVLGASCWVLGAQGARGAPRCSGCWVLRCTRC